MSASQLIELQLRRIRNHAAASSLCPLYPELQNVLAVVRERALPDQRVIDGVVKEIITLGSR